MKNLVLVVFISISIGILLSSCHTSNDIKYYRVQENGFYGFIDSVGNVVINPQYKYVSPFTQEGYACVISSISMNEENACIHYGYVNKRNEIVIDTTQILSIPIADLEPLWNVNTEVLREHIEEFNTGKLHFLFSWFNELAPSNEMFLFQDQNTGLIGYKSLTGELKVKPSFKYGSSMKYGVAFVTKGISVDPEKSITDNLSIYSLINENGDFIKEKVWSFVTPFDSNKKTWCTEMVVDENSDDMTLTMSFTQIDTNGKICIGPVSGMYGTRIYNNSYADNCNLYIYEYPPMFDMHIGYSFINKDGRFATDFNKDNMITTWGEDAEVFQDVTNFSEGVAGVQVYVDNELRWVFMNSDFEVVHNEVYDSIAPFREGLSAVEEMSKKFKHMGEWGFINRDFEVVIPYKFSEVGSFQGGRAYAVIRGTKYDREGIINRTGEFIWETQRRKIK